MLEINWTMEQKRQRDKEKKRDEKIKKDKIIKYSKEPQYVLKEIDGKLVIHNKPLEEWISEEQPVKEYLIQWREDDIGADIAASEQLRLLFLEYPIIESKPQIFYDALKKKYVLWKDPRLPKIFHWGEIPAIARRVVQE